MLGSLLRRFRNTPAQSPERTTGTPSPDVVALRKRLEELERSEALREAEWADALERFERLYRRTAARQQRDAGREQASGESTLELRRRLRG